MDSIFKNLFKSKEQRRDDFELQMENWWHEFDEKLEITKDFYKTDKPESVEFVNMLKGLCRLAYLDGRIVETEKYGKVLSTLTVMTGFIAIIFAITLLFIN